MDHDDGSEPTGTRVPRAPVRGHRDDVAPVAARDAGADAVAATMDALGEAGAPAALPPKGVGPLGRREMRLAYALLIPTFLIVLGIVLGPLLANLWISLKPVELADLRAPRVLVNERLRPRTFEAAGETGIIQYRVRNSSQDREVRDAAFTDIVPPGLVAGPTERCTVAGQGAGGDAIRCELGDLEGGARFDIEIPVTATPAFVENPVRARDAAPVVTGSADNVLTSAEVTGGNFRRLFSRADFWHVLRVSLYYTVFGTAGALVLGLFAAQLLNTVFPFRGLLRGLFLFPYVAPVIAVAFAWVLLLDAGPGGTLNAMLQRMGATDGPINFLGTRSVPLGILGLEFPVALATVIAFEAWRYFPLAFLFILARMQSVSSEMYEAAEIDGATPLQQFWYISLPQLAGILAVLFLLRFIWTFNKFDDIFLLTGGASGTRTLVVDVYEQAFALSDLGAGAAVAVVVFAVLLAFSLIFFRLSPKDDG